MTTTPFIGSWTWRSAEDGEVHEITAVVVHITVLPVGRVMWAYISEMGDVFASDESDSLLSFDRLAEAADMESPWTLFSSKVLEPA